MSGEGRGPFPAGLRALNHRDFRLFWVGQLVSLIGTWMQSVGQSWLVLTLTDSPFKLGLVGALQFSPILFFSVVAGAITDRLPKRRLVILTQTVLLLQALVLAILVWHGHVQYWHVAILASVYGLANTFDMPARQAFIVDLVGKSDLLNAIALNSGVFNAARVVGPAAAGLLIARYGTAAAFFFNAASFLAVIAALLAVRSEGLPHPRERGTVRGDIAEGVAYAVGSPRIMLTLALLLCVSLFLVNYNVLVPLLAREVLHQDAHGFGVLMAAVGAGAVLGAALLTLLGEQRPPMAALIGPAIVFSLAALAMTPVRTFWLAAALLFVMGCSGMLFMASANTTVQVTVPDALRGRLMSLYMLVFVGVTPFGSLLFGAITEAFGVPAGFLAGGVLGFASVGGLALWWTTRTGGSA